MSSLDRSSDFSTLSAADAEALEQRLVALSAGVGDLVLAGVLGLLLGWRRQPGLVVGLWGVAVAGIVLLVVNYFYITVIEVVRSGTGLWFQTKREFIPTMPIAVPLSAAAAGAASAGRKAARACSRTRITC